jgi:hypothetical protein
MNSPFVRDQAKALASTLMKEGDAAKRVEALYRRAVGRAPNAEELKLALAFLKEDKGDAERALADLCVVIFNTHEFVYVP